jgi:hypothetical protein
MMLGLIVAAFTPSLKKTVVKQLLIAGIYGWQ